MPHVVHFYCEQKSRHTEVQRPGINSRRLFTAHVMLIKQRNGFNSLIVIEKSVMLVRKMQSIRVESEPEEYRIQPKHRFKQCNNRNRIYPNNFKLSKNTFTENLHPLAAYPVIKQAGLLLLTHLYNNRANATETKLIDIPFGVHTLLRPYRPLVM